jgi:aryl-alcohol dehydrogenase-like predicted oxidoreductase
MTRRRLGRTGLQVSRISLGTVEMGLDYGIGPGGQAQRPGEEQASRLLHRALELGVNFIDTARAYGESEAIIGRSLRHRRPEYILCSKVLAAGGERPEDLRARVTSSVDTSLRLLGTASVDIMMIHSATAEVLKCEGLLEVLQDLRDEGKFRWIGASVYGEDAAFLAIRSGRFDCLQVAYSALDRRHEDSLWEEAARHDIGIVARSVLLKGVLTSRYCYLPEHLSSLRDAAGDLERLAHAAGMSLPEMAYRYVLSGPLPHTALVGASNLDELESAVRFSEADPLQPGMLEAIRRISVADEQLLNPGAWGVG